MHFGWKNCPTAWASHFTGKGIILAEAVTTKNQWIWHSFFGLPGTNNDLNVLSYSSLFDDVLNIKSPTVHSFEINQKRFQSAYYLCNGIYPSGDHSSSPSPTHQT
jgi:hypothetical protein